VGVLEERKEKRMNKLEEKKVKAIQAIEDAKAIQARQEEVKSLFVSAEIAEEKVSELLKDIKKSAPYADACQSFRVASVSALSAIEDKVFKTQQELADFLEIDKNKMSRIIKSGRVFKVHTSEDLALRGLDELQVKVLTHDDPKLITELINGEKSVEEVKAEKDDKKNDTSKKLGKAIDKVIELLGDSSINEMDRWNAFKQIRAQVINVMPKKIAEQEKQLLDQWQAMQAGKKSKVNA
jgi:delta 1-pyrroline-5-carboxylate dehydrogenase